MNKQQLNKMIGTIVKLRPKAQRDEAYISDERNRWHVLDESQDKKGLMLKNVFTEHEFIVAHDSINQYRSPDFLVLRGQLALKDERSVIVEPFMDARESTTDRSQLSLLPIGLSLP